MKKRMLSLLLVLIMVLGMFPMSAMATETNDTVYISVSFDGQYVNDKTGEPMAYIPVSLSELQAIDLEEYDLTEYDCNGQLTALHLYIYTHEKIMGEDWDDVGVSGGAGSIFFENGLFGFQDCNLQYYCNGKYPEVDGWGVTADQLVLNDGDFVDVAAYTSWSFYSDSAFGFHYFLDNEEITHEYAATAGEALTVTLGRGASYMGSGSTVTEVADYTVSYGTAFGTATGTVTTNTDGQAEITFAEADTYYLWVDGGYGAEYPQDIVSAPGCAKVTVTEPACTHETWNAATCKAPKTCTDCGATDGEANPNAHNYVEGACEYCSEPDPSIPVTYTVTLPASTGYTAQAYGESASPVTKGGSYSFTVTIADGYEASENFGVKANGVVLTAVDDVYTINNITDNQIVTVENVVEKKSEAYPVTVIAPIGSTVSVGALKNYFIYTFAEPLEIQENETEETVTYGFSVPNFGGNSFVRVQHPDGVTYWDYVSMPEGTEIAITEDMLFMNDSKHNADTIIHDLSEYEMDVADVYINANAQGYLPMNVGDTFEFNVFRNWHAVEGISNNKTALPDVHYQVIGIDGTESDVLTIVPDANNSSTAVMTANKAGTAIVLVTYDAMYSTLALRGGSGTAAAEPAFFSAIWPENTGVVVVTVDADGSLQTNMMLNNHVLDAEHDVLYYLGTDGASYSFAPESGSAVSVARSTVTDKMSFCGFTTEGIVVAEDGTVTVTGLTTGTHIIKVEKDGAISYQVIRAKATTVTVTDSEGEIVSTENPVEPGETVTLQFGALYNPIGKLPTIYNSGAQIIATGEDGTSAYGSAGEGAGAYYLFAWDTECHKVQITVPETWLKATFDVNGFLKGSGFGSLAGGHRSVTYKEGAVKDDNAPAVSGGFGLLPTVQLPVNVDTSVPVTSVALDKTTAAMMVGEQLTLTPLIEPADTTFVPVWISSDASVAAVENGVVTANGEGSTTITLTIGGLSASCEITVSKPSGGLEIVTGSTARVMASRLLSKIRLVGVEGSLQEGYTETEYVIKLPANTDKDKMIVVEMTAELTSAAKKKALSNKIYFWANTPNATNKSEKSVYGYSADCSAPGSLAVQPEWDGNTAIITLGLGDASSIVANSGNTKQYTLTLIIESDSEPTTYTVTLPTETTGYTVTATEGSASPVNEGSSYSFTVTITEGYEAGESFAVKANDVELTAVEGVYTISNITADQTVTVEGVVEKQEEPALTWQEVMAMTQTYLTAQAENKAPVVGTNKGEWMVLGLARNGMNTDNDIFKGYYDNVVRFVEEKIDTETGRLDKNQATVNARVILGLTSIGKDVTDVAGHNLLKGLSDTDFVKKQGINGPVWTLIALDSHDYEIPTNADSSKQVTRQWLIDYILDNQLEGGGWKISGTSADDMTPMAVQALAPYYNSNADVKAAIDKALTIMEGMVENASPETLAQIIVARSTMGLDSEEIVNKMLAFALEDGSFKQSPSATNANQMSTEQAFYAMVAYSRFLDNKTALYDMSDVVLEQPAEQDKPVESVTLSSSTLSMKIGETDTLVALVSPADATNRTVSWSSSDTNVAAVSSDGVVTAISEGAATITATAGEKSASCIVTVTKESSSEPKPEFGLTEDEIIGYVTVSFEDNATRKNAELSEIESKFRSPLGTIIRSTRVPFKEGDTIASVTLRLLTENEFTASYEGDEYGSFYLEAIGNFTATGNYYSSFGEFDAGRDSGWMITWNGWFIDQGASEFEVKNGDVVRWQYTCQLGADIGDVDWNDTPSEGNNPTSEDRAAAREVKGLIEAIGTVTKDSGAAIKAARSAYNALTDAQKDFVPNYDDLVAAEKKYAELTKDDTKMVFTDVSESDYYYEAVKWAVELGITNGTSDTTFSPNASCTRAQMVTFLWRAAGEPKAKSATCIFTDVDKNAYYYEAMLWAVENGITNGTSGTTFSPNASCTRAQMVTFLYRNAKTPVVTGIHSFTDVKSDAYYNDAVIWAAAEGITNGTGNNAFSPDAECTRCQMVTFLYRYLAK